MLIDFTLYSMDLMDPAGLIIYDEASPYRWHLQAGGTACVQVELPGVYLPITFDDWDALYGTVGGYAHLVDNFDGDVQRSFDYENFVKPDVDELLEQEELHLELADPPPGHGTHEACLWVRIKPTPADHHLHPFTGRLAVLFWPSSD